MCVSPAQGESVKYFLDNLDRIGQLVSPPPRPPPPSPAPWSLCVGTWACAVASGAFLRRVGVEGCPCPPGTASSFPWGVVTSLPVNPQSL